MKLSEKKELQIHLNETPINFSLTIDSIVHEKRCSYQEAILIYCDENNLEPEQVATLVTQSLKAKIEVEASALNLIKKEYRSQSLPLEDE